jgi:hypothetical protein
LVFVAEERRIEMGLFSPKVRESQVTVLANAFSAQDDAFRDTVKKADGIPAACRASAVVMRAVQNSTPAEMSEALKRNRTK